MCIIIDANCAAAVFTWPTPKNFQPIHHWITKRKGFLVLGGKNKKELFKIPKAKLAISEWNRTARASFISDEEIAAKEVELRRQLGLVTSNDEHVLALAIISGARWLCSTGDGALCHDFKNLKIVPPPKGKIYKYAAHGNKLNHTPSCYYSKNHR